MNYDLQPHNDYRVMKVFLDIKHPFTLDDGIDPDIYVTFKDKMDSPALRGLTLTGFNDKTMQVGEYIDHIKAVQDLIEHHPEEVQELMANDKELKFIHPAARLRVWQDNEIARRTGFNLGLDWTVTMVSSLIAVRAIRSTLSLSRHR